ncbi:Bifunctional purine biosynthesis protein PurH [Fundidesulfovibrio magnetotacticus]|uniref:Bifunctional purine biosynthesis protein PurH n=1 Tax=Fundidesulfovibrio magnetotacticus TaxID=2730080 RepID=A0A6V8LM34_9BACT|nr:IMP cyclohydrolase [Fundidesulfovibrio magnetotacticus]GFK93743.1 Bifunctional purine biosynthesis protein PurH [Fundidesulfovibrio magnetotacticus]
MELLPIRRAILSVTDKSGLAEFAAFLHQHGVELVSTGGTKKAMADAGLPVTAVDSVTGFPEMLGGRVKTLHPHIHAGILADKDDPEHLKTLEAFKLQPFDLICVNLYDFAKAAASGANLKQAVEQIDIGGPTMLRASAKNLHSILVVPSAEHYARVTAELSANAKNGTLHAPLALRRDLAVDTFRRTSAYDAMISDYLGRAPQ